MTKTFTINGRTYEVSACTAIAIEAYCHKCQDALYVVCGEDRDEKFAQVVFGWDFPETEADFVDICEDTGAWTSDHETLATVRFDKERV